MALNFLTHILNKTGVVGQAENGKNKNVNVSNFFMYKDMCWHVIWKIPNMILLYGQLLELGRT